LFLICQISWELVSVATGSTNNLAFYNNRFQKTYRRFWKIDQKEGALCRFTGILWNGLKAPWCCFHFHCSETLNDKYWTTRTCERKLASFPLPLRFPGIFYFVSDFPSQYEINMKTNRKFHMISFTSWDWKTELDDREYTKRFYSKYGHLGIESKSLNNSTYDVLWFWFALLSFFFLI